jgi:hypothetical protein
MLLDDSLENCRRFASNKDVAFPFLRVRSSNCAKKRKKKRMAQPTWLKLDEIARTLGRICGGVVLKVRSGPKPNLIPMALPLAHAPRPL